MTRSVLVRDVIDKSNVSYQCELSLVPGFTIFVFEFVDELINLMKRRECNLKLLPTRGIHLNGIHFLLEAMSGLTELVLSWNFVLSVH